MGDERRIQVTEDEEKKKRPTTNGPGAGKSLGSVLYVEASTDRYGAARKTVGREQPCHIL